jgi:hypothetical protein
MEAYAMKNTMMQVRMRTNPTRRTAPALLGALAVTLAGVAGPLAGTAYAGGNGGVGGDPPESRPPPKPKMVIGDPAPALSYNTAGSRPDKDDAQIAGKRPGAGVAPGNLR